jgi:hypothetical protein
MRLIDGDDLRTLVERDGPIAPARAAAVVGQVAAALARWRCCGGSSPPATSSGVPVTPATRAARRPQHDPSALAWVKHRAAAPI